ncbi:hypothetical protein MUY14_00790 [Amycolatopsis sp. FBCC-B4732]|uniref:hypothetical protein n=1 Tax=Amycolatopsis sp. FBCC-B4732 TaxID=3079339 RepID=UPI001FF2063F|nr:hypothetical protein [Amycolatopsis sp. FBCC-B4732]UOX89216.1 hypothetical protein MUY14_00790 [Amycolatopsis sp. FBCC-B4732]
MTEQTTSGSSLVDEWLGMRVLEHVRDLYKEQPDSADRVLKLVELRLGQRHDAEVVEARHRRRLEWAWFGFRAASALLGFGALVVFALIAAQFIGHGAPTQASVALGAGAVSVVAIFVTGRAAGPLFSRRAPEEKAE